MAAQIETYEIRYEWEKKTTELTAGQNAQARAALWGVFRERNCYFCKRELNPRELHWSYSIHHEYRKHQKGCNYLQFLHLCHVKCNTLSGQPHVKGIPKVRERENLVSRYPTDDASDELKLNFDYEEPYRAFVIRQIFNFGEQPDQKNVIGQGLLSRNWLNAAACENCGANPKTGYPYMAKLLNPINGIIELAKHPSGAKYLRFRKLEYYGLKAEKIEEMHPKTGQLSRVLKATEEVQEP